MAYSYNELRGEIIKKYGNLADFAKKVLGITPTQFSKLLNNKSNFDAEKIEKCITALNIKRDEVGKYFFTLKVSKSVKDK